MHIIYCLRLFWLVFVLLLLLVLLLGRCLLLLLQVSCLLLRRRLLGPLHHRLLLHQRLLLLNHHGVHHGRIHNLLRLPHEKLLVSIGIDLGHVYKLLLLVCVHGVDGGGAWLI